MTSLGTFAVTATGAEVAAFRAATGLPAGESVPLTFPMRWLAADDVRDALMALVAEPGIVPVHESQVFDYANPLLAEKPYSMRIEARRVTDPDRLIVAAALTDDAGRPAATVDTILRLFATSAAS